MPERELTRSERAGIRKLTTSMCANFDHEYGCLPLDCPCYMLHKWWTGAWCKYFVGAVLPLDPVLEASLMDDRDRNQKPCDVCGRLFAPVGRQVYCSESCREKGLRKKDARRKRERRRNMRLNVLKYPQKTQCFQGFRAFIF